MVFFLPAANVKGPLFTIRTAPTLYGKAVFTILHRLLESLMVNVRLLWSCAVLKVSFPEVTVTPGGSGCAPACNARSGKLAGSKGTEVDVYMYVRASRI